MKIESIDIIALVGLIGGYALLAVGINGVVSMTITLIIGYYFGKKASSLPGKPEEL